MFNANNGSAGTAPEAQVVDITVLSGYTVAVNASDSWINAQLVNGNTGVEISVAEYTESTEPRTGTVNVVVSKEGTTIITKTIEVTQNQVGNTQLEATVEFTPSDLTLANKEISGSKDGVSILHVQGDSTTALVQPRSEWRVYKNSNFTVTAPGNISKIEIAYNTGSSNKYVVALEVNTGSFTLEGATGTWTPTGDTTSVNFRATEAQARIDRISITYIQ